MAVTVPKVKILTADSPDKLEQAINAFMLTAIKLDNGNMDDPIHRNDFILMNGNKTYFATIYYLDGSGSSTLCKIIEKDNPIDLEKAMNTFIQTTPFLAASSDFLNGSWIVCNDYILDNGNKLYNATFFYNINVG